MKLFIRDVYLLKLCYIICFVTLLTYFLSNRAAILGNTFLLITRELSDWVNKSMNLKLDTGHIFQMTLYKSEVKFIWIHTKRGATKVAHFGAKIVYIYYSPGQMFCCTNAQN